jgi:hypothetical protein
MLLYSLTIFLSAFLLFQVQPIVAKTILPWFGGSSAVWSTCMLFFQVVLLLGYLYAHWLHEKLAPRKQGVAHIAALVVSFAALPILPNPGWKSAGVAHPSLTILALLSLTVGLPYFLLSSTSPLLQAWYARTHREGMPYRLFALSNFASMLALLSYPFVVEPNLPARMQGLVWSAAYVCFAALCGTTAWRSSTHAGAPQAASQEGAPAMDGNPAWTLRLLWLGLAASASVLLLAVTNHLTQDVAAIPFLWILPLSVYLFSFIVCFESPRFYRRAVFLPLMGVALGFMAYRLWPYRTDFNPPWLSFLTQMPIRWCAMASWPASNRTRAISRASMSRFRSAAPWAACSSGWWLRTCFARTTNSPSDSVCARPSPSWCWRGDCGASPGVPFGPGRDGAPPRWPWCCAATWRAWDW